MIRDYVANINDQDQVCLVDLDKGIPYHSVSNDEERQRIWDDGLHLTPAGYDRMATLVFDAIKSKL
jgi:lysophospholipase L1-like esterase